MNFGSWRASALSFRVCVYVYVYMYCIYIYTHMCVIACMYTQLETQTERGRFLVSDCMLLGLRNSPGFEV